MADPGGSDVLGKRAVFPLECAFAVRQVRAGAV